MNINEDITAKEVRLVKEDGEQMGVVDIETAMKAAREDSLDLVELVPEAKPPVCKIMDYKHFLYDQKQKAKEAKKNQKQTQLKEMKLQSSPWGSRSTNTSRIPLFSSSENRAVLSGWQVTTTALRIC